MNRSSLIFVPNGGAHEFADIAEKMRGAAGPKSGSRVLAIPNTYVEWMNVEATHLALHAMDVRGYFQPLVLVPLLPFTQQPSASDGFRRHPLFRLAWHGHPSELTSGRGAHPTDDHGSRGADLDQPDGAPRLCPGRGRDAQAQAAGAADAPPPGVAGRPSIVLAEACRETLKPTRTPSSP